VRDEVIELAWATGRGGKYLILEHIAVALRHHDGSLTVDRTKFPSVANIVACTSAGFLAGLTLAAPLTGASIGAMLGSAGTLIAKRAGISDKFLRDVGSMMRPGTSALFVVDQALDMEVIVHKIQGLGGTVLKTNVAVEQARLIQSTLAATAADEPLIALEEIPQYALGSGL
jgi:uncharacterized membrane protein